MCSQLMFRMTLIKGMSKSKDEKYHHFGLEYSTYYLKFVIMNTLL